MVFRTASDLSDPRVEVEFQQLNPKRKASESAKRYDKYKLARTVGDALQLGATKPDLSNDYNKGYLKLAVGQNRPGKLASRMQMFESNGCSSAEPRSAASNVVHSEASSAGCHDPILPLDNCVRPPATPLQASGPSVGAASSKPGVNASFFRPQWHSALPSAITTEIAAADTPIGLDFGKLRELRASHEAAGTLSSEPETSLRATPGLQPTLNPANDAVVALDTGAQPGETIRLRCRLGVTIRVKLEPGSEPSSGSGEMPSDSHASSSSSSTKPASDVRQLLLRQQSKQAEDSSGVDQNEDTENQSPDDASQRSDEEAQRAAQDFEAAQLASYQERETEKRKRLESSREDLRQGSLAPLEELDRPLIEELMEREGGLEWLMNNESRLLLFNFLDLKRRNIHWYKSHAEEYFKQKSAMIPAILGQPDADALTEFLQSVMSEVNEANLEMPEPGRFVPRLFAPQAYAANGVTIDE